jgi:hypothetical protein
MAQKLRWVESKPRDANASAEIATALSSMVMIQNGPSSNIQAALSLWRPSVNGLT